jgi:hypothetical protein
MRPRFSAARWASFPNHFDDHEKTAAAIYARDVFIFHGTFDECGDEWDDHTCKYWMRRWVC